MSLSSLADAPFTTPVVSDSCQENRIKVALGLPNNSVVPRVDRRMLSRYYEYLLANMSFPFIAHYPEPTNAVEEREFRCVVSGILSPDTLCDEFDGLFCKVRKENCKLNVPLIELVLPQKSSNFQLIEDYWYWLWNWR